LSNARDEILARVRAATSHTPSAPAPSPSPPPVPRDYRRTDERPRVELVELFCERVGDYRADVQRVAADQLRDVVALAAAHHSAQRLVIPAGLPELWRPAGLALISDDALTPRQLDGLDGVITGCTVAIAETGTIALTAAPHEGRRVLSLVPDLHICIVDAAQITGGVPEAITRLEAIVGDEQRPVTLISGPSATSDIELQRVEGVHGPRKLVVLVIEQESAA
jgi:L-lactate dehydrogenase complex protein LldG